MVNPMVAASVAGVWTLMTASELTLLRSCFLRDFSKLFSKVS